MNKFLTAPVKLSSKGFYLVTLKTSIDYVMHFLDKHEEEKLKEKEAAEDSCSDEGTVEKERSFTALIDLTINKEEELKDSNDISSPKRTKILKSIIPVIEDDNNSGQPGNKYNQSIQGIWQWNFKLSVAHSILKDEEQYSGNSKLNSKEKNSYSTKPEIEQVKLMEVTERDSLEN